MLFLVLYHIYATKYNNYQVYHGRKSAKQSNSLFLVSIPLKTCLDIRVLKLCDFFREYIYLQTGVYR
jgi:hypothetical protein